ncbi:sigma-70 family RNA polymerase sigma factor [Pelagibius sp. Alg239-R121]|uniref:sigma-70 family RNA polymerase sigma factor n=1 Tax=Pelagibius sp. Alg239-R121 TaxID=2993448 RepID=UPI0024A7170C|nr:sigma-70 family RNA polymerase sigma factor [Pelagibius sp. Alg239-R121]
MTLQTRQQTFEAKTRPLLDSLFRTALRMTQEKQAAEDLVQDTCLKAFRALHRFETGTNYRAWIFKIMTNTCIDLRRAQAEPRLVDLDSLCHEANVGGSASRLHQVATVLPFRGVGDSDPEIDLQHKDFRDAAVRSVGRLSPDLRIVVVLAIFEEFTYAEIAEVVGCPIGTVRSRLSRGRQVLQEDLIRFVKSDSDPARPGGGGTGPARKSQRDEPSVQRK